MSDLKNTLLIIGASVLVVIVAIYGLTKMSTQTPTTQVDQSVLMDGARFIKENGETKVTVVAFSDMQCPACKTAHDLNKELYSLPGVKSVMRQFPLPANIHKYALVSAKAVEAARIMGKGWEMMDILFTKQDEWSTVSKPEDMFVEYAKSLGLDGKKYLEALNSKEAENFVAVDTSLASRLQLSGTPTIFVNGEQVGAPFVKDKVNEILGVKK